MASNVNWDMSQFLSGMKRLGGVIDNTADIVADKISNEVLRLSTFEVPHDQGLLQASGHSEPEGQAGRIVGYNKVYAARLHEHPEYRFQKGRKGKYLIDPIIHNLSIFKNFAEDELKKAL